MTNDKASRLRQTILMCNTELTKLKPKLEESEELNEKYNKVLIKKAICRQKLKAMNKPLLSKIFGLFRNKNEKLICDYFK